MEMLKRIKWTIKPKNCRCAGLNLCLCRLELRFYFVRNGCQIKEHISNKVCETRTVDKYSISGIISKCPRQISTAYSKAAKLPGV